MRFARGANATGSTAEPVPENANERLIPFALWDDMLQGGFERCFFIPKGSALAVRHRGTSALTACRTSGRWTYHTAADAADDAAHGVHSEHVRRRPSYRDTVNASRAQCDYQLRPNMLVAMVTVRPRRRYRRLRPCRTGPDARAECSRHRILRASPTPHPPPGRRAAHLGLQAPELFTPARARAVLATISDVLIGPLGTSQAPPP